LPSSGGKLEKMVGRSRAASPDYCGVLQTSFALLVRFARIVFSER